MAAVFQIIATGVFKNINDIISLPNRDEWLLEKANSVLKQMSIKEIRHQELNQYQDTKTFLCLVWSTLKYENKNRG